MENLQAALFALADADYKQFQCALIPTVDPDTVIGVRIPALRRFAKTLSEEQAAMFMKTLPHRYYEENCLHAFLIECIDDIAECLAAIDRFLPYVDNWATCDSLRPLIFKKHKAALFAQCDRWRRSQHPYAVRFALEAVMLHGLQEGFELKFLQWAIDACCEDYYVNMMVAWFLATALAYQYEATVPVLKERQLPPWVHAKTVQKALESRRFTPEQKAQLRLLKNFKGDVD